jgi:hypothetical protein
VSETIKSKEFSYKSHKKLYKKRKSIVNGNRDIKEKQDGK